MTKPEGNIKIQAIFLEEDGIKEPLFFDVPYFFTNDIDDYLLPDKIIFLKEPSHAQAKR